MELSMELMAESPFQRLPVPPGIPPRPTSTCGGEFSSGVNFTSCEACLVTISATVTGLLGWLISRRFSNGASGSGDDKIGSTVECIRGRPSL